MMTVTGIFVQILRFWPCLLAFSLAILNFATSCAYGIPEHELNIMYARFDQSKMKLSKENTKWCTNHLWKVIKFFYHLCILNLVCLSNLWKYWTEKFLYLSQAKIKEDLFIGPKLKKIYLMKPSSHISRKERSLPWIIKKRLW